MSRIALHWQVLIGMLVGSTIGLSLNWGWSVREVTVGQDDLPAGVSSLEFVDTRDRVEIRYTDEKGDHHLVVDPASRQPGDQQTLKQLEDKHPRQFRWFKQMGRSPARWIGDLSHRFGNLFLRLLRMVAIPLIITSLTVGVLGLGTTGRLGRMFSRTLLYYIGTSFLAIVTGLLVVNMIRPGLRGGEAVAAGETEIAASKSLPDVLFEQLETMIPTNPIQALAEADFLSIISFTIAFAIFTLLVGGRTAETIHRLVDAVLQVMMKMTMAIIRLVPLGVMLLMLYVTATQGPGVFQSLAWYMLAVLLALVIHSCIILPLILWFVAGRNPLEYAKAMSPALLTAFSSASSNGTLPLTMTCAEERAGINNRVGSFVLPLGATINMDGTALYEVIAVLFIAQMEFGHNLELGQQIIVAVTALLASIGAAGIPHAGLVMMVIILEAVGLPVEKQGLIIAVDRILDMCRTSVNVWSDSCGCAVIARFEKQDHGEPGEAISDGKRAEGRVGGGK
jgi:Na+/H+-dicarboxylate symporter